MTEAMSRHEIEDVLSSIRRLVSHDDRAAQTPAQPAGRGSGKLVLTSALRVDDDQPSTDHGAGDGSAPDCATVADHDTPAARPDDEMLRTPDPVNTAPAESVLSSSEIEEPLRASLVSRIAQAGHLSSMATEADRPSAPEADAGDPVAVTVTDSGLETTLARLEQALSITAPERVASGTGSDAATGPDADSTLIDEAALTDLVAKIVRQELQGELGERITRNIRKLVRAEVARELQMRNL